MNTNQDTKNKELRPAPEEVWNEFGDWADDIRLAQVRKKRPKVDVDAQWTRFEKERMQEAPGAGPVIRPLYGWLGGVAAACVLAVLFFVRPWSGGEDDDWLAALPDGVQVEAAATEGWERVSVARGSLHRLVLADGTQVCLSPDSRLLYPRTFDGPVRRVELQGEAYFEVQPDAEKPFVVVSDRAQVCVLGTHFTVRAYDDAPYRVSLMEGSVRVKSLMKADSVVMKPGEDVCLQTGGSLDIRPTDGQAEMWQKGFFYYDNAPLRDILKDVCRFYNATLADVQTASMERKLHFKAPQTLTLSQLVERLNSLQSIRLELTENNQIRVN